MKRKLFRIFYIVHQGFRLNLGKRSKMITFQSLMTTFNVSYFWASRGSNKSLSSNCQIKLSLSNSVMHIVAGPLKDSFRYFDTRLLFLDDSTTVRSDPYNFITDIFFLAHKSQDLGFRVCHEKFMKLNQVRSDSRKLCHLSLLT